MRTSAALILLSMAASQAYASETTYARFIDENLDRTPTHTVVPEYPHVAMRDRIEGEVQVCYHIDRRGRPYRVAVRSSTHRVFERPARRAVRASTWEALADGEEASNVKTCRTFTFELTPVLAEIDETTDGRTEDQER
ncbi:MAG: energy transducer TonB [Woeseiaceae bacterium]|nr:energy transducer TonB [Woeseiaceae bacterium]